MQHAKTNERLRIYMPSLAILALAAAIVYAQTTESTTQPPTQPATQPASQPTSQPATQPSTQPASQPVELNVPPVPDFIAKAEPTGKKVLIHYKTNFAHDDNPGCVAFNAALAARAAGHEVEMLYDAGGVYDLQLIDGQPAAYHYVIPEKFKAILAAQYPLPVEDMPHTYRDYLHWLDAMGVRIAYNGFMAALVDLQDEATTRSDRIEPIAEPLSLHEMLEHREAADVYLVY